ncbi:hypothetical protein Tco_0164489 [Tanacetum coccineum]
MSPPLSPTSQTNKAKLAILSSNQGWVVANYHLKELRCSTQCHTQMSMWIISRGVVLLILLMLSISFKFGISGLLQHVVTAIADRIRDKDISQSKQNLQSSSMTFIYKTLIIPSVLDSCFNSSTVCEVKRVMILLDIKICAYDKNFSSIWTGKIVSPKNVYIRDFIDFDATMFYLEWFVKYSANVRRTLADFSHAPLNEYSPSPNDKKQWSLGCWFGGKLIQKLRQKGVYEESFSRHAAWIGGKLIQLMHTTMIPEQVKTMKIQAVVQGSRPEELRRHLQLWKRF